MKAQTYADLVRRKLLSPYSRLSAVKHHFQDGRLLTDYTLLFLEKDPMRPGRRHTVEHVFVAKTESQMEVVTYAGP